MFSQTLAAVALLGMANAQLDIKVKPASIDPAITPGKPVGSEMPVVGFGTWTLPNNDKGANAVARAIKLGYRHFDGATAYTNQQAVGKGIALALKQNAGVKREDLWITSKIWASQHKNVTQGIDTNLKQLGLDYVDLSLVHFPIGNSQQPKKGAVGADGKPVMETVAEYDYLAMWKDLEAALKDGKTRHIGISNFNVTQLEDLLAHAKVKPQSHQIEMHPYLQDWEFHKLHQKHGIKLVAYAPLGNTNPEYHYRNWKSAGRLMLNDPVLTSIANKRGCTPAQVALVWNVNRNVTVIPKAYSAEHAIENYEALQTCKLTDEDMAKIKALDKDGKGGKRYWDMCCFMSLPCYLGLQDAPAAAPVPADYCEDPSKKATAKYNSNRSDLWIIPKTTCQRTL